MFAACRHHDVYPTKLEETLLKEVQGAQAQDKTGEECCSKETWQVPYINQFKTH